MNLALLLLTFIRCGVFLTAPLLFGNHCRKQSVEFPILKLLYCGWQVAG